MFEMDIMKNEIYGEHFLVLLWLFRSTRKNKTWYLLRRYCGGTRVIDTPVSLVSGRGASRCRPVETLGKRKNVFLWGNRDRCNLNQARSLSHTPDIVYVFPHQNMPCVPGTCQDSIPLRKPQIPYSYFQSCT